MSQSFSLYSELSVKQNLVLRARLFSIPESEIPKRLAEMLKRFDAIAFPSCMQAAFW